MLIPSTVPFRESPGCPCLKRSALPSRPSVPLLLRGKAATSTDFPPPRLAGPPSGCPAALPFTYGCNALYSVPWAVGVRVPSFSFISFAIRKPWNSSTPRPSRSRPTSNTDTSMGSRVPSFLLVLYLVGIYLPFYQEAVCVRDYSPRLSNLCGSRYCFPATLRAFGFGE